MLTTVKPARLASMPQARPVGPAPITTTSNEKLSSTADSTRSILKAYLVQLVLGVHRAAPPLPGDCGASLKEVDEKVWEMLLVEAPLPLHKCGGSHQSAGRVPYFTTRNSLVDRKSTRLNSSHLG